MDGSSPPVRTTLSTVENDRFYLQEWTLHEHTGTHVDAPIHFVADGRSAAQLRVDELIVPAVVIDISEKVAADPAAELGVDDVEKFEHSFGRIPRRSAVMMYSGWETRAGSNASYVGTISDPDEQGDAVRHLFPGFSLEAAEWLLHNRDIASLGVDVVSLDPGPRVDDGTLPVHELLLRADKYGIENLRNVGTIPPIGSEVFVGLVPWEGGSGGPCRVLARW